MTDDNIIHKINALLATAGDSAATENEAATAMRFASALMLKHGIEATQLGEDGDEITAGVGSGSFKFNKKWIQILSWAAGELYGCKTIIYDGSSISFVGRPENIAAAEVTMAYLMKQVISFYKSSLPKGMSKGGRAKWRRDFHEACAIRLMVRVREINKSLEQDTKATGSTALVVIDHKEKLSAEVDDFFTSQKIRTKKSNISVRRSIAAGYGNDAGGKIRIHNEVS